MEFEQEVEQIIKDSPLINFNSINSEMNPELILKPEPDS